MVVEFAPRHGDLCKYERVCGYWTNSVIALRTRPMSPMRVFSEAFFNISIPVCRYGGEDAHRIDYKRICKIWNKLRRSMYRGI